MSPGYSSEIHLTRNSSIILYLSFRNKNIGQKAFLSGTQNLEWFAMTLNYVKNVNTPYNWIIEGEGHSGGVLLDRTWAEGVVVSKGNFGQKSKSIRVLLELKNIYIKIKCLFNFCCRGSIQVFC